MAQIADASLFEPGTRLPMALFTRHGVKLLRGGAVLTPSMCEILREFRYGDLYLARAATDLPESPEVLVKNPIGIGRPAPMSIISAGGVLTLQAGEEVESHHLDALALGMRGTLDPIDLKRQWAGWTKMADQNVAERAASWERIPLEVEVGVAPLELSEADRPGWPTPEGLARFRDERVELFRRMFARILAGLPVKASGLFALVDELIEKLEGYPERYTQIALLAPRRCDYLPDHCYATAVLAVAIAARLRWSRHDVRLAGVSGLLADAGMGLVPREVRSSPKPLNEIEINRVRRHPAFSVVLLEEIDELPESVRRAVYQHHERENGAGYPLRLKSHQIGAMAKVVAVADAYAAATEPRTYRVRKRPYDAMEELIMLGSQRMYDRRCVRALVESTGLFPVGSSVKLSDGRIARVVGAHAGMVDRPIVEAATGGCVELLDLTEFSPWELSVIQAVDALPTSPPTAHPDTPPDVVQRASA